MLEGKIPGCSDLPLYEFFFDYLYICCNIYFFIGWTVSDIILARFYSQFDGYHCAFRWVFLFLFREIEVVLTQYCE